MMTLRFQCLADFIAEIRERVGDGFASSLDLRVDIGWSLNAVIVTARVSTVKDTVLRFEMPVVDSRHLAELQAQIQDTLRKPGWTVRSGIWEV